MVRGWEECLFADDFVGVSELRESLQKLNY